jgi:hypothetical protein
VETGIRKSATNTNKCKLLLTRKQLREIQTSIQKAFSTASKTATWPEKKAKEQQELQKSLKNYI